MNKVEGILSGTIAALILIAAGLCIKTGYDWGYQRGRSAGYESPANQGITWPGPSSTPAYPSVQLTVSYPATQTPNAAYVAAEATDVVLATVMVTATIGPTKTPTSPWLDIPGDVSTAIASDARRFRGEPLAITDLTVQGKDFLFIWACIFNEGVQMTNRHRVVVNGKIYEYLGFDKEIYITDGGSRVGIISWSGAWRRYAGAP